MQGIVIFVSGSSAYVVVVAVGRTITQRLASSSSTSNGPDTLS